MDQVEKRGPGRPPSPKPAFFVAIPGYMADWAVDVGNLSQLTNDIAAQLSSILGESFTLDAGALVTQGGSKYTVKRVGNEIVGYAV